MLCYECSQAGARQEAIGLCQQHASMIANPVTTTYLIRRTESGIG